MQAVPRKRPDSKRSLGFCQLAMRQEPALQTENSLLKLAAEDRIVRAQRLSLSLPGYSKSASCLCFVRGA